MPHGNDGNSKQYGGLWQCSSLDMPLTQIRSPLIVYRQVQNQVVEMRRQRTWRLQALLLSSSCTTLNIRGFNADSNMLSFESWIAELCTGQIAMRSPK